MPKAKQSRQLRDETISSGFGRLVSVTTLGSKGDEVILWFEDTGGDLRAVRMSCNLENGLGLEIAGQAMISRT